MMESSRVTDVAGKKVHTCRRCEKHSLTVGMQASTPGLTAKFGVPWYNGIQA